MRCVVFVLLCLSVTGTLYVAQDGSDNPSCGSISEPCATLQAAVESACVTNGQEISVGAGQYQAPQSVNCSLSIQSSQGSSRTILTEPSTGTGMRVQQAQNFTLNGFTIQMGAITSQSSWLNCVDMGTVILSDIVMNEDMKSNINISRANRVSLFNVSWTGVSVGEVVDSSSNLIQAYLVDAIEARYITITNSSCNAVVLSPEMKDFQASNWTILEGRVGSLLRVEEGTLIALSSFSCSGSSSPFQLGASVKNLELRDSTWDQSIFYTPLVQELVMENVQVSHGTFLFLMKGDNATFRSCSFSHISHISFGSSSILITDCKLSNITSLEIDLTSTHVTFCDTLLRDVIFKPKSVAHVEVESCQLLRVQFDIPITDASEVFFSKSQLNDTTITIIPHSETTTSALPVVMHQCYFTGGYIDAEHDLELRESVIENTFTANFLHYSASVILNGTTIRNSTTKFIISPPKQEDQLPSLSFYNSSIVDCSVPSHQAMFPITTRKAMFVMEHCTIRGVTLLDNTALIELNAEQAQAEIWSTMFEHNEGGFNSALVDLIDNGYCDQRNLTYANNIMADEANLISVTGSVNLTMNQMYYTENVCLDSMIYIAGASTVLMNDSEFWANNATCVWVDGEARPVLRTCQFINNTAVQGSSIVTGGHSLSECHGCVFERNRAHKGGALYGRDSSALVVTNSTFQSNVAVTNGGAYCMMYQSVAAVTNCTFLNNTATIGSALYSDGAGIRVNGSLFQNNWADESGTATFSGSSVSRLAKCQFQKNSARQHAGAILIQSNAAVTLEELDIFSNDATSGGGISILGDGRLVIESVNLRDNSADQYGGGIFQGSSAHFAASHLTVERNSASTGGGYFGDSSQLLINASRFADNTASKWGGAVMTSTVPGAETIFEKTVFINNKGSQGGAMAVSTNGPSENAAYITFTGCHFESNSAIVGGAISTDYAASVYFSEPETNNFVSNNALLFGGAVHFHTIDSSRKVFMNVFFTNNSAGFAGGAVMVEYLGPKSPTSVPNIPSVLCTHCNYTNNSSPGYQTDDGWASAPSRLAFENGPCGQQFPLDHPPSQLMVHLEDSFGTPVQGGVLDYVPFSLEASFYGSRIDPVTGLSTTVMNHSGQTELPPFNFCSKSDGIIRVAVSAVNDSSHLFNLMSIQPISDCTFTLGECSEDDEEPAEDPNNPLCQICKSTTRVSVTTVVLLSSVLVLCVLLSLLVGSLLLYRIYRRMKYRIYESLEIPDIMSTPGGLSLNSVLEDSSVRLLRWDDVGFGSVLGKGAFGVVSRGTYRGEPVAIKELILGIDEHQSDEFNDFLKEIVVMSALQDPNIVRFVGVAVPDDQSRLCLVTELMERGSIQDLMNAKGTNISQKMRLHFALGAAKGIAHLHTKNLIHRDLKADNLLVDRAWNCKVADFGISTLFLQSAGKRTCTGTPTYMAPEVLLRDNYTHKADVFSFGIVLYELFSGLKAYSSSEYSLMSVPVLNDAILQGARPDASGLSPSLRQLVEQCWASDPADRPSCAEICIELEQISKSMKAS